MPTVELSKKDLEQLVGKKIPASELEELFMQAKAELESVEGDLVKADVKDSNRPDLWSCEGIARELKAFLGKEKGVKKYSVKSSGRKAFVDSELKDIRPFAAYAVAKNVKVTDELIKQIVQLQEKICISFGSKRKEVAIGIFDLDKVKGDIRYYAADKKQEFVPLGYGVEMSLEEILQEHPKGKEYGHLIKECKKYPLLVDSGGAVLSMPPIINSEGSGKITPQTRNLFIDVTGFSKQKIEIALKVVCAALADRGAGIQSVEMVYGKGKKIETPSFGTKKISFDFGLVGEYSGLELKPAQVKEILTKKRMNAVISGKNLVVEYADYRQDILHAVDVIEDILVAYGYNRIEPLEPKIASTGAELEQTRKKDLAREACVGLGLQEVLTYTLVSRENQEKKMLLKKQEFVEVENFVSQNYQVFRKSIIPEHLAMLAKNKHISLPQKIFEIGSVFGLDEKAENKVRERIVLCATLAAGELNFNDAKSVLQAMCKCMGLSCRLSPANHAGFIEGRAALIEANGKKGIIGEIHPKILENFGLETPVAVIEMDI